MQWHAGRQLTLRSRAGVTGGGSDLECAGIYSVPNTGWTSCSQPDFTESGDWGAF